MTETEKMLLDIIASYRLLILKDNNTYPTAVLSDIESSAKFVLNKYKYDGRLVDELKKYT